MSKDVAEKAVYVCECMCVLFSVLSFFFSSFFFVLYIGPILKKHLTTPKPFIINTHTHTRPEGVKP